MKQVLHSFLSGIFLLSCGLSAAQATTVTKEEAAALTLDAAKFGQVSGVNRFQCTYIATAEEIRSAPSITNVRGKEYAQVGDIFHMTDAPDIKIGDIYVIFRQGDVKMGPELKKVIGYEAIALGQAQVMETNPEITLKVLETSGKIRAGNRVLAKVVNASDN